MMNPFTTLPKLIRSKPLIDELAKETKSMNTKNWKTTVLGVLAALVALAQIWAPKEMQPRVQASAAALAGLGLVAAKDQ